MSIFEDKKHNGLPYIGQQPVITRMVPNDAGDCKDATRGLINIAVFENMNVRNIRNSDEGK